MKGRVNYVNLFISFTINSEFDQTRKDEKVLSKGYHGCLNCWSRLLRGGKNSSPLLFKKGQGEKDPSSPL